MLGRIICMLRYGMYVCVYGIYVCMQCVYVCCAMRV